MFKEEATKTICEAIGKNNNIEMVIFTNLSIYAKDATAVSNLLTESKSMTSLIMPNCHLHDPEMEIISQGLSKNETVTHLDF